MPSSLALEKLGTISVYRFQSRLSSPNTIVFPDAPRPCVAVLLIPRTRRAPKYDSSSSTMLFKEDTSSHSAAIFYAI